MSGLPKGWVEVTIEDVTRYVQRGKSPKYTERSDLPVVNQKCIRWSGVDEAHLKYVDPSQWGAWSPERFLIDGDILWNSTGTGTIGRAAIYRPLITAPRAVADSHVTIVRTNTAVLPSYLHGLIRSPVIQSKLEDMQSGSTNQVELSKAEVLVTPVPLPPLPEQRRIVAKIDSLTAKSRRARDHLDHIPRLVEKYKQAILAAAYSEAQAAASGEITLGDLASEVRNGLSKKPTEGPEGIPILRISAVRPRRVWLSDFRYYPDDEVPTASLLRSGDLLFTRYNGNPEFTAVCGQVRDLDRSLTYPDKLIRVRVRDGADPSFVELICTSSQARSWLTPYIKSAAGQHGISGADLKRLPVPLPPIGIQAEIVHRIETAFAWIDRLAAESTSARKLVDRLDQAVLAKAFRGELVPQDPADEPASVLLERIRAERGAAPKARRGRRPAAEG